MNMELMAMRWLRWEQRCMLVLLERTPRYGCGQPDVLGISCSRYATEIEIKRSMSDFRADAKKFHRVNRENYINRQPRQLYYFVLPAISERVLAELPDWAGLMTVENGVAVQVIKKSPVNTKSERYSIKECVRLAEQLCNQIISSETRRESITSGFRFGHEPYWRIDYEI